MSYPSLRALRKPSGSALGVDAPETAVLGVGFMFSLVSVPYQNL